MDATYGKFLAAEEKGQASGRGPKILEIYEPLVPAIARRIARTLPPSFDRHDLEQTGRLAILEAAPRIEQYVRQRVEGAIRDSARYTRYRDATHQGIAEAADVADKSTSPLDRMVAAEALDSLPADQRRVIEMRIEGRKAGRPTKAEAAAEQAAIVTLRGALARAA